MAISGGLLWLLFSRVDFARLWALARNASLPWLARRARALPRHGAGQRLAMGPAARRRRACSLAFRWLTGSFLVATFFNNFLPSNIGGDVDPDRRHRVSRRLEDARHNGRADRPRASACSGWSWWRPSARPPARARSTMAADASVRGLLWLASRGAVVGGRPGAADAAGSAAVAAAAPRVSSRMGRRAPGPARRRR